MELKKTFAIFWLFLILGGCSPVLLPTNKNHLYMKGRVSLQNTQFDFLGSVEIFSHPEQLLFFATDPFFRPILQFAITRKKIIITQNKKTRTVSNNKKNREKILGLDLNTKEFHSIFWGGKKQKTDTLIFSDSTETPQFVKKENSPAQVEYLAWRKTDNFLLPTNLKISSTETGEEKQVTIKLVITRHKINP
jgi:outer membrane biogenesis lipoprotein LolB